MSLQEMDHSQVAKLSMIELANMILVEEKKEMSFLSLFDKVASLKQYSESVKSNNLPQFYTDLNVDGRFIALGSNVWGLKQWFPVSKTSEKLLAEANLRDLDEEEDDYDEDFDQDIDFDPYDEDEE